MEINVMKSGALFDPRFLAFYQPLHERFTPLQQIIADKRKARTKLLNQAELRVGYADEYKNWPTPYLGNGFPSLPKQYKIPEKFDIQLPKWCYDQRNQMTGPADNAALVVKMLNSGAPGVMVDLEDSQANDWENTSEAYVNLYKLFRGELTYTKNDKEGRPIDHGVKTDTPTVLWVRPRGLHMAQVLRFPLSLTTVRTSATLLDVAITAYNFANTKLPCPEQPLTFYIPKTEYAEEAEWWSELFKDIAKARGWPPNYIKCMALVEAHSFAYQAEQFVWVLRDHLVGLNLGRWDYMASLIEQNLWDPEWVLPDRNTIPHNIAFFQNLRKHLVNVCHNHGILAIGGMTALYPSRKDAELNERALKILEADKKNEAEMGMDGAWTGHPDQNKIAVDQFPEPNQIEYIHASNMVFDEASGEFIIGEDPLPEHTFIPYDLRPDIEGGNITPEGTRQCVRVAIRYRNGVLNGRGASLLDGYMEDLATDRICRLMIAQRMKHLPDYTKKYVSRLFDEELARLLEEGGEAGNGETLRKARILTEEYVVDGIHTPN